MRFSENRIIAWCVLCVCVFVSVFVFGGMAVVNERSDAVRLFEEGADTSLSIRHSMDSYLDASADSAQIMASEAEMHSVSRELTDRMRELAACIGNGDDIGEQYRNYSELKVKVDQLYNSMYDAVSDEEFVSFKMAYDDFWGYEDMLVRDEYHKAARDYNKMTGGFPGRLIAGLFGQSELNTFGG